MAYFAYTNIDFNKGKAIYTKTIFHEKSKKSGLNEWIHPDMIGFYIPIEDWNQSLLEFNNQTSLPDNFFEKLDSLSYISLTNVQPLPDSFFNLTNLKIAYLTPITNKEQTVVNNKLKLRGPTPGSEGEYTKH